MELLNRQLELGFEIVACIQTVITSNESPGSAVDLEKVESGIF
jgi:hypothetical protein